MCAYKKQVQFASANVPYPRELRQVRYRRRLQSTKSLSVAKPWVSKWGGGKGEGTGGGVPLPLGARELCPRKIFQITDARR
jgi:hypothetical protein